MRRTMFRKRQENNNKQKSSTPRWFMTKQELDQRSRDADKALTEIKLEMSKSEVSLYERMLLQAVTLFAKLPLPK